MIASRHPRRSTFAAVASMLLAATVAVAQPPPAVVESAPPPLSPAMRVIYAPFYVAGLVIRYGVYYVIVAPLEVFGRALNYGVEGGVSKGDDR